MSAVAPKKHRIVDWAINVLLAASVLLAIGVILPAVLGYQRYVIDGHSMEPAIPYGSVAYETKVPVDELAIGDVITFKPPPEYGVTQPVTHRIVKITTADDGQRAFRTKGDNNDSEDPWTITLDQSVQPRVKFHIPYVGYVYIALSIWWVRFLLIVLPALAIAVWILVSLWREAGRDVEAAKQRSAPPGRPAV